MEGAGEARQSVPMVKGVDYSPAGHSWRQSRLSKQPTTASIGHKLKEAAMGNVTTKTTTKKPGPADMLIANLKTWLGWSDFKLAMPDIRIVLLFYIWLHYVGEAEYMEHREKTQTDSNSK